MRQRRLRTNYLVNLKETKMTVDIQNRQIIIIDTDQTLESVVISQLLFWNYYPALLNQYQALLSKQLFIKTFQYFNDENIIFSLTENAKQYLDLNNSFETVFEKLKEEALQYKEGHYNLLKFDAFKEFVSTNIRRSLKNHQLKSAYHLYILGNAANFSVPGSGKTSVVLTVYEKLRIEGKVNSLFVVGPPACFGPWKNEFISTLDRNPNQIIFAGNKKIERKNRYYAKTNTELYLSTFQALLFDNKEVNFFFDQKDRKIFFVVDEAHYIKQINGNWANAVLSLATKAKFRCVLTGTPMPKSFTDIFNLFDFLWPENNPISNEDKIRVKVNEEKKKTEIAKSLLNKKIGPLFYRVRKTDLNLSKQNFKAPVLLEMNKYEQIIYNAIYNRIRDYSKEEYFKNIDLVSNLCRGRIIRLRQTVSYAKLLKSAIDNYDEILYEDDKSLRSIIQNYDNLEVPSKIQYLLKKIDNFKENRVKIVIWSNFINTIKLIKKHVESNGHYCKIIYGEVPIETSTIKEEETREKIIEEFIDSNSNLDILIANPAACAESISLHKTCHNAIYYDLSYNCAQYLQSIDRIHRVGGSEFVQANYHFLQYKNTIDLDIKNNLDLKASKMFDIIEKDYNIYSLDMFDQSEENEAYNRLFR